MSSPHQYEGRTTERAEHYLHADLGREPYPGLTHARSEPETLGEYVDRHTSEPESLSEHVERVGREPTQGDREMGGG